MPGQGTTTVDFGAFPGGAVATVDVTGQTGLTSANLIEAFVMPIATADHTVDEHIADKPEVTAYFLTNGSFRIVAMSPDYVQRVPYRIGADTTQVAPETYGQWTIGWVWN